MNSLKVRAVSVGSLFISLAMCFSLVSCGGGKRQVAQNQDGQADLKKLEPNALKEVSD